MSQSAKTATGKASPTGQEGQRFVYQDDEQLDKEFDWVQIKRLSQYIKPYSKQILPVIITMMIVGALTKLLNPLLIAYAIDHALREGNTKLLLMCVGGCSPYI